MIDDSCLFSLATDLKMQSVDEQMNTMSLLNMQNIPDGMISGLSTEQLNWVTVQSNERTLIELDPNTFSDIDDFINNNDFKELSDTITSEIDMLEKESVPKGTQYNTEAHVKKFKNFLIDQKLSTEIETMPVKFLANYLRFFYFNLRCKDGTFYAPRSLIGIRASLHRYLTSCEVDRGINILKDKEFDRPNAILKAMVGKWIKEGNKSKRYPAIEPADMVKIKEYFDRRNPVVLQQEIWFNCVYYFGLRGREVLSYLKKTDIEITTDSESRHYAFIKNEFLTKNVKMSLSQKEFENISVARMYDNPTDKSYCPIEALEIYLSKIPNSNSHLFPLPKGNCISTGFWYAPCRNVGQGQLGKFMKIISKSAKLSTEYTNHSVRVTVVSELHHQGFKTSEIAQVTGQKSNESVARYIRQTRDESRRKLSDALTHGFSASSSKFCSVSRKREYTEVSC